MTRIISALVAVVVSYSWHCSTAFAQAQASAYTIGRGGLTYVEYQSTPHNTIYGMSVLGNYEGLGVEEFDPIAAHASSYSYWILQQSHYDWNTGQWVPDTDAGKIEGYAQAASYLETGLLRVDAESDVGFGLPGTDNPFFIWARSFAEFHDSLFFRIPDDLREVPVYLTITLKIFSMINGPVRTLDPSTDLAYRPAAAISVNSGGSGDGDAVWQPINFNTNNVDLTITLWDPASCGLSNCDHQLIPVWFSSALHSGTIGAGSGVNLVGFMKPRVWTAGGATVEGASFSSASGAFLTKATDLPIADAGADQTVEPGALVTLDGSRSIDPEGDALTYSWQQLAGTTVEIDLTDPARPTFTAPSVPSSAQTLTFQLVVSDGTDLSPPDTVDITVSRLNNRPVADAGDDQDGIDGNPPPVPGGGTATLDGSNSYDPDGDPITCSWSQTGGTAVTIADPAACVTSFEAPAAVPLGGARLTFALIVDDGFESSAPDTVDVLITGNDQPPIAHAGGAVDAHGDPVALVRDEGTLVVLNGSGSSDPEGQPLSFAWTQTGGTPVDLQGFDQVHATFVAPPVSGGGQLLEFELAVSDGAHSARDRVLVQVVNANDPPNCDLALPSVGLLWPPNHKLHSVGIQNVADPNGDGATIMITGVTQDEPVSGLGDGDTSPDAVIQVADSADAVLLRAERDESGDGRVYVASFMADDGFESCDGWITVGVPLKRKSSAIDSGQSVDSTLE